MPSTCSTTSAAWRRRSSCVRWPRKGSRPGWPTRGYALQGFENQLALVLDGTDYQQPPALSGSATFDVAPTTSSEDEEQWIDVVVRGFSAGDQLAAHDVVLTQGDLRGPMRAFQHQSLIRYLVRANGEPVGGGAAYVIDGVVGLTGTATIPSHRGRGVQHAVVARMLRDAAGRADLAMATVEPGSQSQRAFERFGLRVIYTRAVFMPTICSSLAFDLHAARVTRYLDNQDTQH